MAALQPQLLLHGHIHPYGQPAPDRWLAGTRVVNVVGHKLLELEKPAGTELSARYAHDQLTAPRCREGR